MSSMRCSAWSRTALLSMVSDMASSVMAPAALMSLLRSAFSATILAYCAALAVVGAKPESVAIYTLPPTVSRVLLRLKASQSVITSIGSLSW